MLESYFAATKFDPKWYKAWHAWSLANLDLIESLETQGVDSPDGVSTTNVIPYVIAAVDGTGNPCLPFQNKVLTPDRFFSIDCVV